MFNATNCSRAGHPLRHLHLDWEVSGLGQGESQAIAWNILGYLSRLERIRVSTTRCRVHHGGQRSSAILVDLSPLISEGLIMRMG